MLAKARALDVSEVVLDLEDAVVPERKAAALDLAVAALAGGFSAGRVSVRVNPPRTPWAHAELIALAGAPATPATVIVPKVESAGDLAFVERLLDGAQAAAGAIARIGVQALIETAAGVARMGEITAASPRLEALILGYADLGVSLGRTEAGARDLDRWLAVQDAVIVAARVAGVRAIDGPFLSIDDVAGLRASARRAAELGFDGKWAIHPAQLDPIRDAFTPSEQALTRARAIVAALGEAERAGDGTLALDGQMIDEPVRLAALRTLALAGIEPAAGMER